MRYIVEFLVAVLTVIALCGCTIKVGDTDNSKIITKSFDNKDFSEITFDGAVEADIVQDSVYSIKVEASENNMEMIEVTQDRNKLHIGFNDSLKKGSKIINLNLNKNYKCKVYITTPDINMLELAGSGLIGMDALRNSETVNIAVTGSGMIVVDTLYAKDINTTVTGSGNITFMDVHSTTFSGFVTGSGDIMPSLVGVDEINAQICGSGMQIMKLENCGTVNAEITGSGCISLSGTAKSLKKNIAGMGRIETKELNIKE